MGVNRGEGVNRVDRLYQDLKYGIQSVHQLFDIHIFGGQIELSLPINRFKSSTKRNKMSF